MQHLARRGAKVYLGARNEAKAKDAIERLKAAGLGEGEVIHLQVDVGDVTVAKAGAEDFMKKESRLDVLSKSNTSIVSHH